MSIKITTPPSARPAALDTATMVTLLGATGSEAAVAELIAQMTAFAEDFTGLYLWYRGYREVLNGDGEDHLYLSARPIVAVSSITSRNGEQPVEGEEDDEFEIWPDLGYLYRFDGWDCSRWTVDFTGGWWLPSMTGSPPAGALLLADARPDVQLAIQEMVTVQWQVSQNNRTFLEARLESMDEEVLVKYRGDVVHIPKTAHQTLTGLRRPVV